MYSTLKRIFIGNPLPSSDEQHQRLIKLVALAVFSSDAISSTAYATEEILRELVKHDGLASFRYLVPISIIVAVLLAIVVTSYRQTIFAYPSGGGSYVVSRENLGVYPALVAGSSLLVDYILTVSVSVAGGVAAIISAFPDADLAKFRVLMCLGAVAMMTLANLRGVKESGKLFAPPTYFYVGSLMLVLGVGLWKTFIGSGGRIAEETQRLNEFQQSQHVTAFSGISLFILMRAFSSGAVALTGVEAVSNGVPAFRKPEPRNASVTLMWMALILGVGFFGMSILAHHIHPLPSENNTVLSQMGEWAFGGRNLLFYILQFSTFAILILAANTAYADFPRLSSIIARDGFLPRQLANRGDRLVFSNGIVVLALVASVLIVAFGGKVDRLIPLYAIGVFTSFTLSQTGMVVHHFKEKERGWQRNAVVNGVGAVATLIVAITVLVSKFAIGAWIPAALIPFMVMGLKAIGRHYSSVRTAATVPEGWKPKRYLHTVVVLVGNLNRGTLSALTYARSLAPDRLIALSVVGDHGEQEALVKAWAHHEVPVELHTVYSPYRELTRPVLKYLDELDAESPDDLITVVIPEVVVTRWYQQFLHNQSALTLKARLLFRPHTVVTSVPMIVE